MLDRAFSTMGNLTYMLKHKQMFLQAVKNDATWIRTIIDKDRGTRATPTAKMIVDTRIYYVSTTACKWICLTKNRKNGETINDIKVLPKGNPFVNNDPNIEITGEYNCMSTCCFGKIL
jgi:hypothetical protein